MSARDVNAERCWRCARRYAHLGLSPLPSRSDDKRPAMDEFGSLCRNFGPAVRNSVEVLPRLLDHWSWGAENVQLVCGVRAYGPRKLVVVDCDGDDAVATWGRLARDRGVPDTWEVRTGSGGLHVWFLAPDGAVAVPSGTIWGLWDTLERRWSKHRQIELLADGKLAVAPPSIHVDTLVRYEFVGDCTPKTCRLPAAAPDWLLAMPRLGPPTFPHERPVRKLEPLRVAAGERRMGMSRDAVLAAIPDKVAVAARWGLRVAAGGRPNPSGWVSCYTDDHDRHPSGSLHAADGVWWNARTNEKCSFFDLGARLGVFHDWSECLRWCEREFVAGPVTEPPGTGR